ncbi:MAG TPA: FTR1 family protein [Solimonas sp.]|nr:FTR1 family protein [Solimonas sp.]
MIAALVIVFREVFEAALIVGIVLAATRGVTARERWVAGGIAAGAVGAGIVAAFAGTIAGALEGVGQEVFNAAILFTAVAMLGWHNVWMSRHGRELAAQMSAVGRQVSSGAQPPYALAVVMGLAVLREGSEVVLFMYGLAAGGATRAGMLAGGLGGIAGGAAVGVLLYRGLLRVPTRHLFSVTSWMILLLAAGMASQGAFFLAQAGYLPDPAPLWDSSRLLSQKSLPGQALHALVGYSDRPTAIQLAFYLATLLGIGACMKVLGGPPPAPAPARAAA